MAQLTPGPVVDVREVQLLPVRRLLVDPFSLEQKLSGLHRLMWSQGELHLRIAQLLDQLLNRIMGAGHPLVDFRRGALVVDDQVVRLFKGDRKSTRLNSSHPSISYA